MQLSTNQFSGFYVPYDNLSMPEKRDNNKVFVNFNRTYPWIQSIVECNLDNWQL